MPVKQNSRKNLVIIVILFFACMLLLGLRLGWIQIVKADEYTEMAIEQQTRDNTIAAERGVIYDTNGNKLAISVNCYAVWAWPEDVPQGNTKAKREASVEKTAVILSSLLDLKEKDVLKELKADQKQIRIARGVSKQTVAKIRNEDLSGIQIVEDTKREYPNGTFLSQTLGTVNNDNQGSNGLELEYNSYLSGTAGRWINYTDTSGKKLSYSPDNEKYYKAEDGYSLVTSIDQVIQTYTENTIEKRMKATGADRVMAIVMSVKTGDILAMAQTPSFDPNDPYEPSGKEAKAAFKEMSTKEQSNYLNRMWRNFLICDTYEPGSTFKLLTVSAALEEDVVNMNSTFTCGGSYTVDGEQISCSLTSGHGTQTLTQAVGNSCNPAHMQMALGLGIDKFYAYMDNFGITDTTGIDFPGEGSAILQNRDTAGNVGLATMGFGQGIAVTPIQLITAVCSIGNEGRLMKPRLVREIDDADGNAVEKIDVDVVRQTISEETASEVLDIMEYAVDEGGVGAAKVSGYRVGGKTGTAEKVLENGRGYSKDTYSSCIAMAPMDDPEICVLLIVDSPKGVQYGSVTAAPGAHDILAKSLKYLNISPDAKSENSDDKVKVPDVVGTNVSDAIGILAGEDLKYDTDKKAASEEDFIVTKQYPSPGSKVKKGTRVYLYK